MTVRSTEGRETLGRAVHRLVGPRVVGPGLPLKVVAPLPALARHPCGPRSTTAMALRSSGRFVRPSVANSLPRSVVTTKFPSSPVSSRAARLVARPAVSAFLFCRSSTAASRVKTSITTRPYFVFPRVFWLKSMRSASTGRSAPRRPTCPARAAGAPAPAGPRRPSEVVGSAPPFSFAPKKGLLKVPGMPGDLLLAKKRLEQGSADARRPAHTTCSSAPAGLPGFKCVQPGLEALAHPPQHAGQVRVVESNHLRAVAPPRGPVKFFHFVPAKSSEAKPSLRSPFMSGRLYCLASTESKSCKSSATSASAISVFTRLSDKSVKLVLQTTLPVLPAITRQPGFL